MPGGKFRPYDAVFTEFIPAMKGRNFFKAEIRQIFVMNPATAFAVKVRSL
jgi:predicted metal-dependent phosphotriesterase family hydrolase